MQYQGDSTPCSFFTDIIQESRICLNSGTGKHTLSNSYWEDAFLDATGGGAMDEKRGIALTVYLCNALPPNGVEEASPTISLDRYTPQ